jgi:hypothetical protein
VAGQESDSKYTELKNGKVSKQKNLTMFTEVVLSLEGIRLEMYTRHDD